MSTSGQKLQEGPVDKETVKKLWQEQAEQIRYTAQQVASELEKQAGRKRTAAGAKPYR